MEVEVIMQIFKELRLDLDTRHVDTLWRMIKKNKINIYEFITYLLGSDLREPVKPFLKNNEHLHNPILDIESHAKQFKLLLEKDKG